MRVMLKIIRRFLRDNSAATSIEYALIAIVIITGVKAVGTKLSTSFSNLSANMK